MWRLGRRNVIWSIALIAILSLMLSEYASRFQPTANFYLLPTRAWELMAGALCSFAIVKQRIPRDNIVSLAGLTAIAVSVFSYDDTIPFPSLYALFPVLGTCAILLFARQETIVGSLLSLKPIVGIGLISYSAYLWHQPLFAFARIRSLREPTWQLMLLLAVTSIALAYLSWRYVEVPARRRGASLLPNRRMAFATLGVVAAVFITAGMAGYFTKGFPSRLPSEVQSLLGQSADNLRCLSFDEANLALFDSCIYGNPSNIRIALVGDSHAHAISSELGREIAPFNEGLIELTHAACPPVSSYRTTGIFGRHCDLYHSKVLAYLKEHKEIDTVVMFARWPAYIEFHGFSNGEGGVEADEWLPVVPKYDPQNEASTKAAIGALYRASIDDILELGKKVVLVYPQPEVGWNVPGLVAKILWFGDSFVRPITTSYETFKQRTAIAYIELSSIQSPDLARVYPEKIFCDTFVRGRCAAEDGNNLFYLDDDHLNRIGASMVAKEIVKAMRGKAWITVRTH